MKRITIIIQLIAVSLILGGQTPLSYYLPENVNYNPAIPVPADIIGHEVGEWHATHDNLILYMKELARLSDRAIWEEYGRSHEQRILGDLIISSPENIKNIESIRQRHLMLRDPEQSPSLDIEHMPVIIKLGYGVHGNESSAQNASLVAAYHFVAGMGSDIDNLLANTVILIDPNLNPDGYNRHSTWVNMHKSVDPVPDPNSRVLSEPWPGGRTNHYWFDLNRDWTMLQHPESTGRVAAFHRWFPTIVVDQHEMGANSTFFWEPGDPLANNPLVPKKNYELTAEIGTWHAKYTNRIGSLYFHEEVYDNLYPGYGSSYPDIHGSIGILIEQAGPKSHLREVESGFLSFPFAIRNQFTMALSTTDAALSMRTRLLEFQREFYISAIEESRKDPVKGYLFTEPDDKSKLSFFIDHLLKHQIEIYRLKGDITADEINFRAEESFFIPTGQPAYRFVKSLFEPAFEFETMRFYDISTWNIAMSFNIPFAPVTDTRAAANLRGSAVTAAPPVNNGLLSAGADTYAYLFEMNDYLSYSLLFTLLDKDLTVRVATQPFTVDDGSLRRSFPNGTIMIHAYDQPLGREELNRFLQEVAGRYNTEIYGTTTGLTPTTGVDLGSSKFTLLRKPSIALMVDGGINSRDAGEIWHMLDVRFDIPVTLVTSDRFNSISPDRYNVIIVAGTPNISDQGVESLKRWNRAGGVIIGYKGGNNWLARNNFINTTTIPGAGNPSPENPVYGDRPVSPHSIPGTIFNTLMDLTHPLCYGYYRSELPVFKQGITAYEPGNDIYNTPVRFTESPLLNGYASRENVERVAGSAFATAHTSGGRVISLYENTNFRAIWYGTNRLFMNAIFFGHIIR
jgi:hypothetical protein